MKKACRNRHRCYYVIISRNYLLHRVPFRIYQEALCEIVVDDEGHPVKYYATNQLEVFNQVDTE